MTGVVLENAMTPEQVSAVKGFFGEAIQFVVSFIYSLITTIFQVVTQKEVIGALVVIALIYTAYRWVKRRKIGD